MILLPDPLKTLLADLFARVGCGDEEARCIGDHLVEANLAGHDSHGSIRAPIYVQWLRDEKVLPNKQLEVVVDGPSFTVADGQLGFGHWIGKQAIDLGIRKCREHGVSIVALRNSGHLGRIGHWAEMAAEAGLVSLHFVNTSGLGMFVVPSGGIDRRLSVNPVTVGVPQEGRHPVILDIAAAAAAEGKLKVARNAGKPVPDGWILNPDGQPTNDPNEFYGPPRGAILPFGGHKGYGLGLVAELLAGAVTGAGCSSEGKTQLEQGMLSICIDPQRLGTAEQFVPEVTRYVDFVKSSRPSEAGGHVLVPGDIEQQRRTERASGLELDEATWGQIVETATDCGVPAELIAAATQTA